MEPSFHLGSLGGVLAPVILLTPLEKWNQEALEAFREQVGVKRGGDLPKCLGVGQEGSEMRKPCLGNPEVQEPPRWPQFLMPVARLDPATRIMVFLSLPPFSDGLISPHSGGLLSYCTEKGYPLPAWHTSGTQSSFRCVN